METKIAILTIGTEITSGLEADTNSHYLSKELFNHGFLVKQHLSVSDSIEEIVAAIRQLSDSFQIVIITGGIGPTEDDLTREAVAQSFGLELVTDNDLLRLLEARHKTPHAQKMASFPRGAEIIKPSKGLVGGFHLTAGNTFLISLPGVPGEIEVLLHEQILPILNANFKPKIMFGRRLFKIANMSEVQVEARLEQIKGQFSYGLLPKLGEVHLYITVKASSAAEAQQKINEIELQVREIYKNNLFAMDDENLEDDVLAVMKNKNLTLSLAESSTGGLVASRIISIGGSSDVFLGSYVTYSNDLKKELGVNSRLLGEKGAVSSEVASEMALMALRRAKSDVAASITGIAGPTGATKEKSVGLHYIGAVRGSHKPVVKEFIFRGSRKQIQWQASQQALLMIRDLVISDSVIG